MIREAQVSGFDPLGLLYVLVVVLVIFSPMLFARRSSPPADEGPEDHGGRGPRRPWSPPRPPTAGPPLPDADQSRKRLRDHGGLATFTASVRRRALHRPARRSPTRVG